MTICSKKTCEAAVFRAQKAQKTLFTLTVPASNLLSQATGKLALTSCLKFVGGKGIVVF